MDSSVYSLSDRPFVPDFQRVKPKLVVKKLQIKNTNKVGFFKKLFKRKKGGTFFGNLLRGVSSTATQGVLGGGSDLARWEEKQAIAEQQAYDKAQAGRAVKSSTGFRTGQELGAPLGAKTQALANTPEGKEIQKNLVMGWLKKKWYLVVTPIVLIIGVTWFMSKGKKYK